MLNPTFVGFFYYTCGYEKTINYINSVNIDKWV